MIRVSVNYGYDLHAISITEVVFAQIRAGQAVVIEGQGFPVEGVVEQDQWAFNCGAMGAVRVMTDEGREVFEGDLQDAGVDVRDEQGIPAEF